MMVTVGSLSFFLVLIVIVYIHLQILPSLQPVIIYFPDCSQWLSRAVPKSNRKEFINEVMEMFDQISGPVVLICGQSIVESGSKEKERLVRSNF